MGSKHSINLREEEIEEIKNTTGFSRNQIIRLFTRFTSLDKEQNGYLMRDDFLRIPELAINPLADRIVDAFFAEKKTEMVNFRDFMATLAIFRPMSKKHSNNLNTREKKLQFVFSLYDIDKDGVISKQELLQVLRLMVGTKINQEQLSHIAERSMLESDLSKDREIDFEEFKKAMTNAIIESKMSVRFLN